MKCDSSKIKLVLTDDCWFVWRRQFLIVRLHTLLKLLSRLSCMLSLRQAALRSPAKEPLNSEPTRLPLLFFFFVCERKISFWKVHYGQICTFRKCVRYALLSHPWSPIECSWDWHHFLQVENLTKGFKNGDERGLYACDKSECHPSTSLRQWWFIHLLVGTAGRYNAIRLESSSLGFSLQIPL
jgi:hypothetical protein